MAGKILDNGALVTLGLVAAVAAVGAANKAGLYGSRALLSASGLSKLTDAELEDYWESLNPSMRNTEAWHLAVTERNVREYRLPNGPAYAAFKASRRSRGSRALGVAGMSASVEKDSLSGLWSVHLHDGHRIVNVTGNVFTTKAEADREAKAMLAQARAGVAIDTLGSMFWEKHHKPLGSAARALRGPPHAGPSVKRMVDQAPVRREVLHLLLTAEVGAGALDAFAETLASGAPLRAEDIEDAVARAEERLEDARYEVRTDRISEHRAGNRADRDHYLRVLKAIRRLRPS